MRMAFKPEMLCVSKEGTDVDQVWYSMCDVEVTDTTVTQAGPCFKTNLADVQLSSTVVGRNENTLTM